MPFGVTRVRVRGFRSARDVELRPRSVCALVGEAMAGKSNLLAAIWALLEPEAAPLRPDDVASGGGGPIRIEADLASGASVALEAAPPASVAAQREGAPPALFLPAAARSGEVVAAQAQPCGAAGRVAKLLRATVAETGSGRVEGLSAAAPAAALVTGIEACCAAGLSGVVLLIEEPELYLRPQAQRYLYRLLRSFAEAGNQVLYSTHSPAFLNVSRLEELALVSHGRSGTQVFQPEPLPEAEGLRALSEFDAERSELFLSQAAVLVEGLTEKLVFPYIFLALGADADREAISIVECGGKPNIPLFATVCNAAGVPYVVVHDRDAERGKEPIQAERALNALIAEVAGPERTIVLEPDFEAVAGLAGHSHKPERARRLFALTSGSQIPEPLARAAELAVSLARSG